MTMKKLFSAVCISAVLLTGCSSGPSKGDQMYEKYGKLIDALEAGNYEESLKAFMEYVPQPETEEVTLTKDNLFDYYELVVEPHYDKDAHGNIKSMSEYYKLQLKPEFEKNATFTSLANMGTVGYEFQNKCFRITELNVADGTYQCEETELPSSGNVDYFNGLIELHSESTSLAQSALLCSFTYYNQKPSGATSGYLEIENYEEFTTQYVFKPESIDIISVTGTLTIRK